MLSPTKIKSRRGRRDSRITPETDELERDTLREALEAANWSITGAAQILGRIPSTVFGFLTRHPDIEAERLKKINGRSLSGRKPLIGSSKELHDVMLRCEMD